MNSFKITVISLIDEKHSDTVFREMEKIFRSKYKEKLTESLQDFGGRNKHALNVITEYWTALHLKMETKEKLAALSGDTFVILTDTSSLLLGQAMKETITEAKKTLTGTNVLILVKGIPMDCLSPGNRHCEPVDRRPLVVSGEHQIGSQCLIPSHDAKMASDGDDHWSARTRADVKQTVSKLLVKIKSRRKSVPGVSTSEPLTEDWSNSHEQPWNYQHAAEVSTEKEDEVHQVRNQCLVLSHKKITQNGDVNLLNLDMSHNQRSFTGSFIKQSVSTLWEKMKSRRRSLPSIKSETSTDDHIEDGICEEKIERRSDDVNNGSMLDERSVSRKHLNTEYTSTYTRQKMKSRRRSLPCIKSETSTYHHTEDTICEEDIEGRSDDVNNSSMLDKRSVSRKHLNTEYTRTYTRQKKKSRRRSLPCIKTETSTDEDGICEEDSERRSDDVNNVSMLDERSVSRKHLKTEYTRTYTRQKMKSRRRSLPCIKTETSTYHHTEDTICEEDIEDRSDDVNNGSMLDERSVSRKNLNTEYTSTYIRQFDEMSSLTRHLESRLSKLKNDTDRMFTQVQPARSTNNAVKGDTPILVSKALNFVCERFQIVLNSSSSNTSRHLNSSTKEQEQVKELSAVSKDGLQMMCEDTRATSCRDPSRMRKGKTCLPSESVSPINRYQFPKILHEVRSKTNKQPCTDPSIPICITESLQTPAAVLGFSKTNPWCDNTVSFLSDSLFGMEISKDDNKRRLLKECPTEPEKEQDDLIQEVLLAKAKGVMDFAIEDIFDELCQLLKHSSLYTCTKQRQLDLP